MHINDACGVGGHMGKVVPLITPKKIEKEGEKEGEKKAKKKMVMACTWFVFVIRHCCKQFRCTNSCDPLFFFKKTCVMRACGEVSNITKCVRGDPEHKGKRKYIEG